MFGWLSLANRVLRIGILVRKALPKPTDKSINNNCETA